MYSTRILKFYRVLLISLFLISCHGIHAQIFPSFGGERAGVSLGSMLKIGSGARAAGMAETVVSVVDDASAVYWNPAAITQSISHHVQFTQTNWFGGLTHQSANCIYKINDASTIGIGINNLSAGSIAVTTEYRPLGTGEFIDFRTLSFGISYAQQFTEQFSSGITVKYLDERFGVLGLKGVLFDAGTFYKTGLGTSRFAVAISNFGSKLTPSGTVRNAGGPPNFNGQNIQSFQSFDPPINFRIGFALEPIIDSMQAWTLSVQLNHPSDNAENYSLGSEYSVMFSEAFPAKMIARGGYKIGSDQERYSFGAGVYIPISGQDFLLQLDYSYTDFIAWGGIQRFTAGIRF